MNATMIAERAAERSEWDEFCVWVTGQPKVAALARLRELVARGNHHALVFEAELEAATPGVNKPTFWDSVTTGSSIQSDGSGRTMPYSGLHKG